jgi:hypothetical protein
VKKANELYEKGTILHTKIRKGLNQS